MADSGVHISRPVGCWQLRPGSISCGSSWLVVRSGQGDVILRLRGADELTRFAMCMRHIAADASRQGGFQTTFGAVAVGFGRSRHTGNYLLQIHGLELLFDNFVAADLLHWFQLVLELPLGQTPAKSLVVCPAEAGGVCLEPADSCAAAVNPLYYSDADARSLCQLLLWGAAATSEESSTAASRALAIDNCRPARVRLGLAVLGPCELSFFCHTTSKMYNYHLGSGGLLQLAREIEACIDQEAKHGS